MRKARTQRSMGVIHPHQRCGYSDSPFARIHYLYTAGSGNGFEGTEAVCRLTQKQQNISKRHFFLMETCFEDFRQDEKHVPDPLESIMRPTDPLKEELRQKFSKLTNLGRKITKIRACTFQMSGKIRDSTNVASEAPSSPPFRNTWPR